MHFEARSETEWLQPVVAQSSLRRFVETVRSQIALVLVVVGACTAAAVVYVVGADDVYEADASLLVSPVPAEDPLLSGLGLIRESSDPTLDVQTAAQLITTSEVAEEAATILDTDRSPESLLSEVRAEPVGQSNIVAVLAEGATAEEASNLANAFGEAVVNVRTKALHERIDALLPPLRNQLNDLDEGGLAADTLAEQIVRLESLRSGSDPTIQLETPADAPDSPIWPRPFLIIGAAVLLGLVLGVGAAYLLRALDPRLRREEQLREMFRLPILARIPSDSRAIRDEPLPPRQLSAPTLEAYRTLQATLTATRSRDGRPPRSLLITSPSPSEGKTSTALNLAMALARAGSRVILVEADVRRPAVGRAFGFDAPHGVFSVLTGEVELADALVRTPGAENLSLLMAGPQAGEAAELFGLPVGQQLIAEAEAQADYVIVDSAPLTAVIDSMPLARRVDGVLIVVRFGKTYLRRIRELGELLAANAVAPLGFALLGVRPPHGEYYYYQEASDKRRREFAAQVGDRLRQPLDRS
jgi:capsular exopolysaccharide synthesis family protein